jgi:hypothetical protein
MPFPDHRAGDHLGAIRGPRGAYDVGRGCRGERHSRQARGANTDLAPGDVGRRDWRIRDINLERLDRGIPALDGDPSSMTSD